MENSSNIVHFSLTSQEAMAFLLGVINTQEGLLTKDGIEEFHDPDLKAETLSDQPEKVLKMLWPNEEVNLTGKGESWDCYVEGERNITINLQGSDFTAFLLGQKVGLGKVQLLEFGVKANVTSESLPNMPGDLSSESLMFLLDVQPASEDNENCHRGT